MGRPNGERRRDEGPADPQPGVATTGAAGRAGAAAGQLRMGMEKSDRTADPDDATSRPWNDGALESQTARAAHSVRFEAASRRAMREVATPWFGVLRRSGRGGGSTLTAYRSRCSLPGRGPIQPAAPARSRPTAGRCIGPTAART